MAGAWGKALNKVQVGFFYDSLRISADGKRAQISGGRVRIRRGVTIADQTNSWTWAGDAVMDGGTSNVNLDGKGDKTVSIVEGQWVTLSSTKRVTKTLKVTATGINYAGGTLTVSVTVTYPQLDPFSPPPPETPDTDAFINPWADEDAPDLHLEPYLQHTYRVMLTDTGSPVEIPAWGVEVTLDGGRAPWATARFKLPLAPYATTPGWFTQASPFGNRAPYGASRIQIEAGWRYGTTINRHAIFSGVITGREVVIEGDDAYVMIECESYESILDYPSNIKRAINNAWTGVSPFLSSGDLHRTLATRNHPGNLPPQADQLAEYRAMEIEANDNVGDFTRACGNALGQWLRGSVTDTVPTLEIVQDPYPYRRILSVPLDIFSELRRRDGLDGWANIVNLETRWTDSATGDTKSKRRTYSAVPSYGAVRGTDITLAVKPPAGNTPSSTWPTGKRWLRRVNESSRGTYSAEARAVWWLQPRIDAVMLEDGPINENAGAITTVTFFVDRGLMRLVWTTKL